MAIAQTNARPCRYPTAIQFGINETLDMEDLTGKQLGQYQIVAPLGEGGMAAVYKAYQPKVERYVALKILPRQFTDDPQFVGRFEQEAKVIAKLQHPHILPIHDFGEADGYTYIVMPFIESGELSNLLLDGRPLPLRQIRSIASQVGEALDYAHSHGLIHRDVKPSNVLIDKRGNCLLTDFGIARILGGTSKFTQTGGVIGTPKYMSPEQGRGDKVDSQSDIYSLGVMLYEMATGRVPFDAETPIAIVFKHIEDPLPLPRHLNPSLPETVERVILRSLAKQSNDRYATAGEMVRTLRAAIPEPTISASETMIEPMPLTASPAPAPAPVEPPAKKSNLRWILAAGVAAAILAVTAVIGLTILGSQLATPPEVAVANAGDVIPEAIELSSTITSNGTEMVLVPAGSFTMGSNAASSVNEKPAHAVVLAAFYVDVHEVTNEQFAAFLSEVGNQSEEGATWLKADASKVRIHQSGVVWQPDEGYADHPVTFVRWYGAAAFCNWRGGRLPREAEWEKAARGEDERTYPWGEDDPESSLANFSSRDTTPVGLYPDGVSPYSVYDMAGNVWEWVADWYDSGYYQNSPVENPQGPASGTVKLVRGGAWNSGAENLRVSLRRERTIQSALDKVGFRCALSPDNSAAKLD